MIDRNEAKRIYDAVIEIDRKNTKNEKDIKELVVVTKLLQAQVELLTKILGASFTLPRT